MTETVDQDVDWSSGDDRNDHLFGESEPESWHHGLQHLRLDREDDEIGAARGLAVAFGGEDAEALLEPVAAIFAGMTGDHVWAGISVLEETRDH